MKRRGIGMVNQQKGVQQDTDHMVQFPSMIYIISPSMFLWPLLWAKNDIGTGIHMIIHYNCTIGSFLLHSFLLIYHPYPPSFHETIFILVPLGFFSLRRPRAPGRTKNANTVRAYITYACALAQTAPLLSRRLVTRQWRLFEESVGSL